MISHIDGMLRPTHNNQSSYDFALILHSKKLIRTPGFTKINSGILFYHPMCSNHKEV